MNKFCLTSLNKLKEIIKLYKFNIKKSLGQNFLIDKNILDKIILKSKIKKKDYVLEIGPGFGVLTQCLVKKTDNLLVVEIDKKIIKILKKNVSNFGKCVFVNEDILKIKNIENLFKEKFVNYKSPIKVVANLPYYIATPIIISFLQNYNCFSYFIIMVQKEIGERIVNNESKKNYGALSVICQYYSNCIKISNVSPNSFYPIPKVESVLIEFFIKKKELNKKEEEFLFKIIRASFGQRRKILLNSLSSLFNEDKNKIKFILKKANINKNRRGETLSLEEFKNLAKLFFIHYS